MAARAGLRQFWKQCRDRRERRGCGARSYVPWNAGIRESNGELPSSGRYYGNLVREHTTTQQWRSLQPHRRGPADIFPTIFET